MKKLWWVLLNHWPFHVSAIAYHMKQREETGHQSRELSHLIFQDLFHFLTPYLRELAATSSIAWPISLSRRLYALRLMVGIFKVVKKLFTWVYPMPLSMAPRAIRVLISYAPGPLLPLLCCLQVDISFGLPHLWHITEIRLAHPLFFSSTASVRESGPGKKMDMPWSYIVDKWFAFLKHFLQSLFWAIHYKSM